MRELNVQAGTLLTRVAARFRGGGRSVGSGRSKVGQPQFRI